MDWINIVMSILLTIPALVHCQHGKLYWRRDENSKLYKKCLEDYQYNPMSPVKGFSTRYIYDKEHDMCFVAGFKTGCSEGSAPTYFYTKKSDCSRRIKNRAQTEDKN